MKIIALLLIITDSIILVKVLMPGLLGKHSQDDAKIIQKKLDAGALVVDVRTSGEFAAGHYPGAINIPLAEIASRIVEFGDKNKPIVVYCRSGNRSGKARALLLEQGYKDVINGGSLTDMMHYEKQ
jgi:phage shock protein E